MGKYEYLIKQKKVTGETMLTDFGVLNAVLVNIANELAEANRLKIIELSLDNHFDKLMDCWRINPEKLVDKA